MNFRNVCYNPPLRLCDQNGIVLFGEVGSYLFFYEQSLPANDGSAVFAVGQSQGCGCCAVKIMMGSEWSIGT